MLTTGNIQVWGNSVFRSRTLLNHQSDFHILVQGKSNLRETCKRGYEENC
jgi:hypothetical protein